MTLRSNVAVLSVVAALVVGVGLGAQPAGPSPEQVEFFETEIRPLLAEQCFQCHGAALETPFGGLRLDSRDGLLSGGDSGPAVVPGDPAASPLVQRVQGRPVLMPPTGALDPSAVESLIAWVEMGAPWPEAVAAAAGTPDPSEPFDLDKRRREHWAWQPVDMVDPPAVADEAWPRGAEDRFILARLEAEGLEPAPPVDRRTLIRRLSFDLRGLPPTPAEIARFVGDPSPDAYADLVDRYLASPHFGERWARHWMDLFRYSESHGSEGDPDIPLAWRYRDYLIRAFNGDVPYDQLIREHVAGDLLPAPRLDAESRTNESIIGTGHYRLVEHGYQPVDPWEDRVKWADNQVDVVSKAFMGLTVSCARCHDHKFDAISQKDYYSLFGTLYGARPTQRAIDDPALLETNRDALAALKEEIRGGLADAWLDAAGTIGARLLAEAATAASEDAAPSDTESGTAAVRDDRRDGRDGSALAAWRELAAVDDADLPAAWEELRTRWEAELAERERFNQEHFEVAWDLAGADYAATVGHGLGRPDVPSPPGEFAIERRGDLLLNGIYPGGAYTHLLSSKHAGVIQTPRFTIDSDFISFRVLGGDLSFANLIIENYAVPRGGIYHLRYSPKRDRMTWAQWDATFWKGFSAYIEFATQDDVTQFTLDPEDGRQQNRPVRRGDGRSSIGVGQVLFHDEAAEPRGTHLPVLHLLAGDGPPPGSRAELAERVGRRVGEVVSRWRGGALTETEAAFPRRARARRSAAAVAGRPRGPARAGRALPPARARRAGGAADPRGGRGDGAGPPAAGARQPQDPRRGGAPRVPHRARRAALRGPRPRPAAPRRRDHRARQPPDRARVAVNRVWRHLFGYGLVRTVDNFGRLGDPPTHPALLDHLAAEFAGDGHSVKRLVRRLVSTAAYRMSSQGSPEALAADPSNRLLQHANLRRLDAEAIRDSILSVSGRLDPTLYGPSVPVRYAERYGLTEGDPNNGPRRRRRAPQHLPGDSPQRAQPVPRRLRLAAAGDDARPARRHQRARAVADHAQQPVRHRTGGGMGAASRRGRGGVDREPHRPHVREGAVPAAVRRGARAGRRLSRGGGGGARQRAAPAAVRPAGVAGRRAQPVQPEGVPVRPVGICVVDRRRLRRRRRLTVGFVGRQAEAVAQPQGR